MVRDNPSPGFNDTVKVDDFSLFFKYVIILATGLVILSSTTYAKRFDKHQGEYYSLILLSATGMMLLASAIELITIYIALELTAFPTAALVAFIREKKSAESGVKFLILSAVSSAVLLYGMVLIYGFTGTTHLSEIGTVIANQLSTSEQITDNGVLLFSVILITAGFGFKISAVPFQMWAPDVYEGAPTPITGFLSVASKAVGFAIILRILYTVFENEALSSDWASMMAVLSAISMSVGNLIAIKQNNIKRMLAYSTIAQAGYIMVGLAAMAGNTTLNTSGPVGILVYLAGYTFTNLAAFAVITAVSEDSGDDSVDSFAGLIKKSPIGFMAKIYLFGAAVETNLTWLAIVGVVNSVVSAYYYLRVVKTMFIDSPDERHEIHPNLGVLSASVISISGTVFFGFFPRPIIELARDAINTLIG
jgi:NADH-quinone oxidoreductase subunit N